MIEARVRVGDAEVAYVASRGTGRPVVLVHGNSSSAKVWRRLMAGPFGEKFRCLALDLPGHGQSPPAAQPGRYSLPGYAAIITGFAREVAAEDGVFVGWSLGGHIIIEAAPALPKAAGFVIFGTPPVATVDQLGVALLPHPAANVSFTADVDAETALAYATAFLAPGSAFPAQEFTADILATDGAARAGLLASVQSGAFADQAAIVARLTQPIAVLHGEGDQLVNLDYVRGLTIPALWRGAVQVLPGAGHAPQAETPEQFEAILTEFITETG